ncbi:MAG: peptidylprolyl isomerase [Candidatus Saliniplasma sp.]
MKLIKSTSCFIVLAVLIFSLVPVQGSTNEDPVATITTNRGTIEVELYQNDAPETVENFIKYAEDGFYDGLIFHRVIEEFMVQGGGFYPGMERKEPTYDPIQNEAEESGHRNERGTIAMARTSDPHSATSQFFINQDDNRNLDWNQAQDGWGYCVFGRVISGMDVVDEIASLETTTVEGHEDVPVNDIIIEEVTITGSEQTDGNGGDVIYADEDTESFFTDPLFLITIGSFIAAGGIIFVLHNIDKRKEK